MVWNTFFHVCPFDREGGGDLSDLGNAHIEPTHFKKGLPFPKNIPPFPQYWGREKACNDGLEHFFCINLPGGLLGCFGTLFFHVCPFDRAGGVLSDLGNGNIDPTHFKKGLS